MKEILAIIKSIDSTAKRSNRRWKSTRTAVESLAKTQAQQAGTQAAHGKAIAALQASRVATKAAQIAIQKAFSELQRANSETQKAITEMQKHSAQLQAQSGQLEKGFLSLRNELDQVQANEDQMMTDLGRVARVLNTFVDGHQVRFEKIEARLDKLEKSA